MKCMIYIFVLLVSACVSTERSSSHAIDPGLYVPLDAGSAEYIKVDRDSIVFRILGGDGALITRQCDYTVWPDKTIVPRTLASSEYFTGIGIYDWKQTENGILRINIRTKEQILFVRKYDRVNK